MTVAILSSHRLIEPFGVAGGENGQCGKNWVERADGTIHPMSGTDRTEMKPGDVFVVQSPTGGGFGPVSERREAAE